jgi:hypothetical protein
MGDISQRYPGVKRIAVCIKEYKEVGYFRVSLLEIVGIVESNEYLNQDLTIIINKEGTTWHFIKDKQDKRSYSSFIKFFDDHFREI